MSNTIKNELNNINVDTLHKNPINNNGYDFSDFNTIRRVPRFNKETIKISESGGFYISSSLLSHFPDLEAEIKLKNDCTQLVLLKHGEDKMYLSKNGRSTQRSIVQKLKDENISFPVVYSGKWDYECELWVGNMENE